MILKLLKELQEKFKMSIIISHNLSILASLCDRILVMYDGEIVEIGPAMSLIQHPYTQALIASIPIPDPCLEKARTKLLLNQELIQIAPHGCAFHPRCPKRHPLCEQCIPPLKRIGPQDVACHLY